MRVWLIPLLIARLVFPPAAAAQAPVPLAAVQDLRILALSGNGGINDLERKIMTPLVVQVLDQESRPVEGAQVIFRFPLNGPSATFLDQQNSQTTRTNADGQAGATGWIANNIAGTFQVQVTATRGNQIGQATLSLTNATRIVGENQAQKKHWWSSKGVEIGLIAGAAGAVAAIVLLARGGKTTVTATPGAPTIGAPQ